MTSITFAQKSLLNTGEKFTYDVELFGFKIGTQINQVMAKEIINGIETYHLKSEIESNPFFSKFYQLSEQIDSCLWLCSIPSCRK